MLAFFRQIRCSRAAPLAMIALFAATEARADMLDSITSLGGIFDSREKYKTEIKPEIPAEDLYNQALSKEKSHDYESAIKKFGEVEKQSPGSPWARKALVMQTFTQYQKGSYEDAVQSAQRYIGLYPNTSETPYMYYLAGMSYHDQVHDVMFDQSPAEKAMSIFGQLTEKFPKSEYVPDARLKIGVMRDQLAAKEMNIGRFYLIRKNYPAAINRFHDVIGKYQATRHTEEALYRLTEAYLAMGVASEAQTAAAILGHNYPDSQWYHDAFALLKNGGLQPHESEDSWLSKIGKTLRAS